MRFGQGLSYSTLAVKCDTAGVTGDAITVECVVTCGNVGGDQILQVYHRVSADIVGRINGTHPVPLSTLVGYSRFTVPDQATVPVTLTLPVTQALSLVDDTGATVLYPGQHFLDVWDGSANNVTLPVELAGDQVMLVRQPPQP